VRGGGVVRSFTKHYGKPATRRSGACELLVAKRL
jgi:hypothetical protein